MADRTCSIEGCERPHHARGWCKKHWRRWRTHGDPTVSLYLRDASVEERFWSKVDRSDGPDACWPWTGATDGCGYGTFWVGERVEGTHRVAWKLEFGPIPDGMWVLHHCDNPPCCNARCCLFLGTHAENMADKIAKGRGGIPRLTHCQRGHEFTPENTYVNSGGHRACRTCVRMMRRRRR